MMNNEELKSTIKQLFLESTPCKLDSYWRPVRCLSFEGGVVSIRYVFFRHCDTYHSEYWLMTNVFEPKYAVFENEDNHNLLVVKATYRDKEPTGFFFSGLLNEDIDIIVDLLNNYKSKKNIKKIKHGSYRVCWMGEVITLAIDIKKTDTGWEARWING